MSQTIRIISSVPCLGQINKDICNFCDSFKAVEKGSQIQVCESSEATTKEQLGKERESLKPHISYIYINK